MHNRIEEIISRLGKKKITQSDFTQLLKYAKSISLKKYPTINEYDREEIVGSVLKSTFFALSSAQIENANRHAYFLRILHSKFCDYFRKQPDASIFRQIQAVLNGDIFVSQPKNQTNWSFRWWRPAQWKKPAQKAGADIIETLLNNLATFSEADIEINLSEKKGFSLPEESIIAYLLYTYSYSEDFFGQRLAFRAEDLKHIIESRLWMVSRINPSIDYEESSNKEKYDWPDQATVGNLGY